MGPESTPIEGGGVEVSYDSAVKLIGCTLVGNRATMGGAICCWGNSSVEVSGCTFVRNIADDASAICVPGGTEFGHCPVAVTPIPGGMEGTAVSLGIYDASGRLVRRLIDTTRSGGTYAITWDGLGASGEPVPSGVYFYRLEVGDRSDQKRVVLLD